MYNYAGNRTVYSSMPTDALHHITRHKLKSQLKKASVRFLLEGLVFLSSVIPVSHELRETVAKSEQKRKREGEAVVPDLIRTC